MSAPRNARMALRLGCVVGLMVAASFAAVPLYNLFCRVTGYGGTTSVASEAAGEVLDRTVVVRFDANTSPDLPWEFRPKARTMEVRIGETGLAHYEAYNPTDRPLAGQASYNVAPFKAGGYFQKIACFCFSMQVLGPGERVDMPVTFFVDPAMVEDREARYIDRITLSYTMHPAELPEDGTAASAALSPAAGTGEPAGRPTVTR
jgi:cytochrome c oxidase assembly protein subunit 11